MLRGSKLYYALAMLGLTFVVWGIEVAISPLGNKDAVIPSVLVGLTIYLLMLQIVLRFNELHATAGDSHYIVFVMVVGMGATLSLSWTVILLLGVMVLLLHFGFRRYNNKRAQSDGSEGIDKVLQDTSRAPVPTEDTIIEQKVGRKGWQLPGRSIGQNAAQRDSGQSYNASADGQRRYATMKGSVFGQVSAKEGGTLRLERNDPHAGRSFIVSLRLEGGDAVGFAEVGDWVEATGTKKSAYLIASRCVNHTTGAVFKNRLGQTKKKLGYVFACVFALFWVSIVFKIVTTKTPAMPTLPQLTPMPSGATLPVWPPAPGK